MKLARRPAEGGMSAMLRHSRNEPGKRLDGDKMPLAMALLMGPGLLLQVLIFFSVPPRAGTRVGIGKTVQVAQAVDRSASSGVTFSSAVLSRGWLLQSALAHRRRDGLGGSP